VSFLFADVPLPAGNAPTLSRAGESVKGYFGHLGVFYRFVHQAQGGRRMLARIRHYRTSHATVVAYLALFIALGGGAYAATVVKRNSVISSSIRNGHVKRIDMGRNAIDSPRVRDRSLLAQDFAPGQLAKGDKGDPGERGPAGDPFPGTLPSGKTLRGAYYVLGTATAANQDDGNGYSYLYTLASAPAAHYIANGTPPPSQCPGTAAQPEAQAGHLCVYEAARQNGTVDVLKPDGTSGSSEEGFLVRITSTATSGDFFSRGSWAVTSP
jgi:hypothetical protein